jgi:nickel-dependent lactate racemase
MERLMVDGPPLNVERSRRFKGTRGLNGKSGLPRPVFSLSAKSIPFHIPGVNAMPDPASSARSTQALSSAEVAARVAEACPLADYAGQRVLLIIPDGTRTAPVGLLFQTLHRHLAGHVRALDILVALGTHPPMPEDAICARLEITPAERRDRYGAVRFFNHAWDDPAALVEVGALSASEVGQMTEGRFALEVPVEVNRRLFEYDEVAIVGPVFPHEVVGFSGGNKYLFPGVGGARILNFFHWLGAVLTTPKVIGHKWTPVRRVVDRAAALVNVRKRCFAMVVDGPNLAGLFTGTPETAWDAASDLSAQIHIRTVDHPFHTILSCAPPMYDEIWTAGKCMYKLEPVLADDGELIIYAPHIDGFSVTHGRLIEEVGYHCRDYFTGQWPRFERYPWGVLAHSTHVHGLGTFANGIERRRARVSLATRIPATRCQAVNLGYRDPARLDPKAFVNREAEGVLVVPKAGEILYRLKNPPPWAA